MSMHLICNNSSVADYDEKNVTINDLNLLNTMTTEGIKIPGIKQTAYNAKVVKIGHPLFAKAFAEIYIPHCTNSKEWKVMTDEEYQKIVAIAKEGLSK